MELRNGDQEAPGRHRIFPKWSKAGSRSACVSATAPKRARCVCQSKMCGRSFGVHTGSTVSPKAEKDAAHQPSRREAEDTSHDDEDAGCAHCMKNCKRGSSQSTGREPWARRNSGVRQGKLQGRRGVILRNCRPRGSRRSCNRLSTTNHTSHQEKYKAAPERGYRDVEA